MAQSKLWTATPIWAVYLIGLLPAAYLVYAAVTNSLGPDPIDVLENNLGTLALRFLLIGLAITPLLKFARINLVKYRRAIGLIAFFYVFAHLSVYLFLDKQMDIEVIIGDIWKRPYITIGMAAFVLLLPLALTSNNFSIRKMGAAQWARLHKLVYAAVIAGAAHYMLLTKTWQLEPVLYFAAAVILVALRRFYPMRPSARRGNATNSQVERHA